MVRLDEGVYIHYMEAQDALNSRHDGAKMVRILMKYLFSKEMLRDGNICYSGDRGKGQPLDPLIVEALFSKSNFFQLFLVGLCTIQKVNLQISFLLMHYTVT